MRNIEIGIFYKGDTRAEKDLAKQIVKMIEFASRDLNLRLTFTVSTNIKVFDMTEIDKSKSPVVIMNNIIEFTKVAPTMELLNQRLLFYSGRRDSAWHD